jgi:hypothetical protein
VDLLIRHCGSNHKRETIAFSKTYQNLIERMAIFLVFRNYLKWFSENKEDATPAMRKGITGRILRVEDVLRARLFPWRGVLPSTIEDFYYRRVPTRPRGLGRPHRLKLAV